jgi:phenylacetate-CoA ligase
MHDHYVATEAIWGKALEALQLERLKRQVDWVSERSDFYGPRLRKAGVSANQLRDIADVEKIPFTLKNDIRDDQHSRPPFGNNACEDRENWLEVHSTSGTTGRSTFTLWSRKDVDTISSQAARALYAMGVRAHDIVHVGFGLGMFVGGIAAHYGVQRIGAMSVPIGTTDSAQQVEFLVDLQPTVIIATPSFGLYLAEVLRKKGIVLDDLALRVGVFGGEPGAASAHTRRALEDGLGIKAFDWYGSAEVGPDFGYECDYQRGLHWAQDHNLIEVIDPRTQRPVEEGEVGVLVVTNLSRTAIPLLRYWTNDLVRMTKDPCPCGRQGPRAVGGVLGRSDDMLIYKGVNFYPQQVEHCVRSFRELTSEYKILLDTDSATANDRCVIQVEIKDESQVSATSVQRALDNNLFQELDFHPSIEVLPEGTLERTVHKAKRVDDKRGRLVNR